MFMIFRILSVAIMLLCLGFEAQARSVIVTVKGEGVNYRNALVEGLKEAVAQVSGIAIKSEELMSMENVQILQSGDNNTLNVNNFNKQLENSVNSKVAGVVKRYEIVSQEKNEAGREVLTMNVEVERYSAPGTENDNRRSIAVSPFKTTDAVCKGSKISSAEQQNIFSTAVNRALIASRRFAVLDRDETEAYNSEKKLLLSGDAAEIEQAKLGQVRGADYILTGDIRKLGVYTSRSVVALTGEVNTSTSAKATVDFKILLFGNRQLKFASSVEVSEAGSAIANRSCTEIASLLINKAADKMVQMMIDDIYPLTVINVKGDNIYLNMGGESLKIGQVYEVNETGETMFDPYTGESLGAEETTVATIKVFDVKPKFSVAKIVKGKIEDLKAGQLCRKSADAAPKSQKKSGTPAKQENYALPLN